MKIDIFNHVMPAAYLELVKQHSKEPGMVKRMSGLRMLWDIEARVAMLRENFPDVRQVLTLSLPAPELIGGQEQSPAFARIANDGMAQMCRQWPKEFPAFVASLPMNNVPAALEEMDRAIGKLGAKGIQICTSVAGRPLDEPRRLRGRSEVEIRDLAGARLAVRDERRHGAHRVFRAARAPAEDAHHHAPLRRHDSVLCGTGRNALGAAWF